MSDEPLNQQTRQIKQRKASWVWYALGSIVLITLLLQAMQMFSTQPSDVLSEVKELRVEVAEIEERTADRFYRSEFRSFLQANPELKPPSGWK